MPTCFSQLRRKPDWPHAQYIYIPLYIHITFSHLVTLVFIYIFARVFYCIYKTASQNIIYTTFLHLVTFVFISFARAFIYIYCIYKTAPQIYKYDIYFLIPRIPLMMKWRSMMGKMRNLKRARWSNE